MIYKKSESPETLIDASNNDTHGHRTTTYCLSRLCSFPICEQQCSFKKIFIFFQRALSFFLQMCFLNNSPLIQHFCVQPKNNTHCCSYIGMKHLVKEAEKEESEERAKFGIKSNKCIYLRFSPKIWNNLDLEPVDLQEKLTMHTQNMGGTYQERYFGHPHYYVTYY